LHQNITNFIPSKEKKGVFKLNICSFGLNNKTVALLHYSAFSKSYGFPSFIFNTFMDFFFRPAQGLGFAH